MDIQCEVIDKYYGGQESWTIFRQRRSQRMFAIKTEGCGYYDIGQKLSWNLQGIVYYNNYKVIEVDQIIEGDNVRYKNKETLENAAKQHS